MDTELARIAKDLRSRYKDQIRQILFFGSRARGGATPESDYDCILVFRQVTAPLKQDLLIDYRANGSLNAVLSLRGLHLAKSISNGCVSSLLSAMLIVKGLRRNGLRCASRAA